MLLGFRLYDLFLLLLPRRRTTRAAAAALLAPLPLQLRHHALGEEALRDQLIGQPRPALLHHRGGGLGLRHRLLVIPSVGVVLAGFGLVHPTLVLCGTYSVELCRVLTRYLVK